MESILTSIKKMLGIEEEYTHFDPEIIIYINAAFSTLRQLGVGPVDGFVVENSGSTWDDFIPDAKRIQMVKSYTYLRVRLLFDPPSVSSVLESFNQQIKDMEWRMNVEVDPDTKEYDVV